MLLEIRKDGRLMRKDFNYDDESYVYRDVTDKAPSHLFDECILVDVALSDIFLLIQRHLEFFSVIFGNWTKDVVEECLSGEEQDSELDYLELYWYFESDEGFDGLARPCFHGIDLEGNAWSIAATSIGKYANTQVRLSDIVTLKTYSGPKAHVEVYDNPQYTLGQILHGIIWEVTFYGSPQERDEVFETIRKGCLNAVEETDSDD